MDTKPLLYGLIGFFLGGLVVSLAATYLDTPAPSHGSAQSMSMAEMADGLRDKTGDDFDKAFLSGMIVHHEGAIEMARLAEGRAKHQEIKQLSSVIMSAQDKEIQDMRRWQADWGYEDSADMHDGGMH